MPEGLGRKLRWPGQRRPESADPKEEDLERRRRQLSNYGFWKYAKNPRFVAESERAELLKWQEIFLSPQGLEFAKKVHAAKQAKKIFTHEVVDALDHPVIKEQFSLDIAHAVLDIYVAAGGSRSFMMDPAVKAYFNNPSLRENFSAQKLRNAAESFGYMSKMLSMRGAYTFRRLFEEFARSAGPDDFTPSSTEVLCSTIKMIESKDAMRGDDMYPLMSSLISTGIVPRQRPFSELQKVTTAIWTSARDKRKEHGNWTDHDIRTLSHVIRIPNIGNAFTEETAGHIFDQMHARMKGPKRDYMTQSRLMRTVLPTLIAYSDKSSLTLENWPTLLDKAEELSRVAGRANIEVFDALPYLGRVLHLDKEWGTLVNVIDKQIKGSILAAKSLRIIKNLNGRDRTMLRFVVERKAGSFVNVLETLGLAQTFGFRLREGDYALLRPLSASSLEDIDKLFVPNEKGRTYLDRFEGVYRRLREENRTPGDTRPVDTSKLRSVIERVRKARERKDLAAAQKLLSDLSLQIGNEVFPYLERRLHHAVVRKAKEEFGLGEFDEAKLHNQAFISGYAIYQKMKNDLGGVRDSEIKNAREVLARYLSGEEGVITGHPKNKEWLKKRLGARAERWMSPNEKSYDITDQQGTNNTAERIQHFSQEASRLFGALGVSISGGATPEELIQAFRGIEQGTLSGRRAELYADLKTQIQGIGQILRGTGAVNMPKSIKIYKETDPVRILNMGTWVSGSCLDANGGNAWSAFVNASEANKGVFWITDEKDRILGRVLVAVDRNGKLLRFPMYYTGSGLDLNPYFNRYLRELAKDLKLGVNGNSKQVEKLISKQWYMDRETPRV